MAARIDQQIRACTGPRTVAIFPFLPDSGRGSTPVAVQKEKEASTVHRVDFSDVLVVYFWSGILFDAHPYTWHLDFC